MLDKGLSHAFSSHAATNGNIGFVSEVPLPDYLTS
jgi:hypothetical protein